MKLTMNRIFFFFVLCFLFLSLNPQLTKAVSPVGSMQINYRLLNDKKAKVEINLDITNNYSDDLISGIQMKMFCSDIKLETDLNANNLIINEDAKSIKINLFDNPIHIGQNRKFNFSFFCNPNVENISDFRSLFVPKLIADFEIKDFKMNIFYPENWGLVEFLSNTNAKDALGKIVLDKQDNLEIQWGGSNSLGFEYDLNNIKAKGNGLIPFLRNDNYQSIEFESFLDDLNLFQSSNGDFFLQVDENIDGNIKGNIIFLNTKKINNNVKTLIPFLDDKELQKIKVDITDDKIQNLKNGAEFLRKNFKFSSKHNLEDLEGDELDLNLLLLSWLRINGINADLNLGWYIGENEQNFTIWISWDDGEHNYDFSILDYIRAKSNVIDKIPAHIKFLQISNSQTWKIEDIREIYGNFIPIKLNAPYRIDKNLSQEQDVQINVFWENKYYLTEFGLKGNLFIKNNTDDFVYIDEILANNLNVIIKDNIYLKNMRFLIAPGQKKDLEIRLSSFDFKLLDTKEITTHVNYKLFSGSSIYTKDFKQTVKNEKIVFPFERFLIIFFVIFIALLLIKNKGKIKGLFVIFFI